MAKPETRIEIFLATPGDVIAERTIVFEEVTAWNETHSAAMSASLHLKHWRNSTYPEMGDRPQATINRQALDSTDLLIAIFWTRFGSPTGIAESGTKEEIRRSISSGRPVMLYFSEVAFSAAEVDSGQFQRLQLFRNECRSLGRYESYRSHDEFRNNFRKHLAFRIQSLLKRLRTDAVAPPAAEIHFNGENHGIVGTVHAQNVTINAPKTRRRRGSGTGVIPGSLKGDLLKWNYVGYLVRQYNEFREKGAAWGDTRGFSYGFIRKRVEQEFGSPAGNLPVTQFENVTGFLKSYVDQTILGRNNRSKGVRNYLTFEEFAAQQTDAKPKRRAKS